MERLPETLLNFLHPQPVIPLCKSQSSCAWQPHRRVWEHQPGSENQVFPLSWSTGMCYTLCAKAVRALSHIGSHSGNWKPVRWKLEVPTQTCWTQGGFGLSQCAVKGSFSGYFPAAAVVPARVSAAFPAQCPCAGSCLSTESPGWQVSRMLSQAPHQPHCLLMSGVCLDTSGCFGVSFEGWLAKEDMLLAWGLSGVGLCIS